MTISNMPAISIRQPWAWAILCAGKRIENRAQPSPWRARVGQRILIHAAKGCTRDEFDDAASFIEDATYRSLTRRHADFVSFERMKRGGFVGQATLRAVVSLGTIQRGDVRGISAGDPWAVGPFCLVLDDVKPCAFLPWKGALGWFEGPADVEAAAKAWAALAEE